MCSRDAPVWARNADGSLFTCDWHTMSASIRRVRRDVWAWRVWYTAGMIAYDNGAELTKREAMDNAKKAMSAGMA